MALPSVLTRPIACSASSARGRASRSGFSAPPSIRLRSSRFRTNRPIRSASLSIASNASRRSSSDQRTSGSSMLPAAARIVASGVRRSCETESRSAVLRASLSRAISAVVASRASLSRATAWPSWSAAADRILVSARSGSGRPRVRAAHSDPRLSPATSTRIRWSATRRRLRHSRDVGPDPPQPPRRASAAAPPASRGAAVALRVTYRPEPALPRRSLRVQTRHGPSTSGL